MVGGPRPVCPIESSVSLHLKLKLLMWNITQESSKVTGWDKKVPSAVIDNFRVILDDMKALQYITFPRSPVTSLQGGHCRTAHAASVW